MNAVQPTAGGLAGPASTVALRGGVPMPVLGFGVFNTSGSRTRSAVAQAVAAGYRHVDTASVYGNESEVAQGIRDAGEAGREVFVTTKVWNSDQGFESTLAACERSRRRLGVDAIDLLLVHWPVPGLRRDTWRAMEQLLDEGKVRAIGVSNYMCRHLEELLEFAVHPPSANQIELSPFSYRSREDVLKLCRDAGIVVQAYSPLTKGKLLHERVPAGIGRRHGKSAAQVLIRWSLQKGLVPLPKSTDKGRIAANADVFDFSLLPEEMEALDALDRNLVTPGWDPTGAP